jgi:hypothetical protein
MCCSRLFLCFVMCILHGINISIGTYGYGGDADTEKAKTCEHSPPVHRIRPPINQFIDKEEKKL